MIQQQTAVNDIINRILEHFNIQSLALIDIAIIKNAFGASKLTNTRLLSKSNSMMLILSSTNIAVSLALYSHLEFSTNAVIATPISNLIYRLSHGQATYLS